MKCRLCSGKHLTTLAIMSGMPKAAQWMPTREQIRKDRPIDLKICQCQDCELVQIDGDPVSYFKEVITTQAVSAKARSALKTELQSFARASEQFGGSRALEIGSAKGGFLPVLEELGFDAVGLEYGPENVKSANSDNKKTYRGYLLDLTAEEFEALGKYDLIIINNFLEHQPRIRKFLRRSRRLLTDQGAIYISVPSLNRIEAASCMHEFVPDHLVYFTEDTLKRAIETTGLVCVDSYTKNMSNDIVAVAKKRHEKNYADMESQFRALTCKVAKFIRERRSEGHRIAIWGAGHRALSLMALAQLQEITFVVDSAEFKQGKFTPILHKEIIPPEEINKKGVTLILLMLPGNLNEIVYENLKNQFLFSGPIYVFDDYDVTKAGE